MARVPIGPRGLRHLPEHGRLLGVDLGNVRIGLALTDPDQVIASPAETVPAPAAVGDIVTAIAAAARTHEALGVVVGYPRTLAGREGAAARRAREIAEALVEHLDVPVVLWDERFTTSEAERVMLAQDASRRERRASIDRVAASLILQGVIESRRGGATWR